VASVVGHTLAGRAVVVDARFVPPAACHPAPATLARYRHIPPNATVADAAARRARAFFARPSLCGSRALDGGRCTAGLRSSLRALFDSLCGPLLGR